MSKPPQHPVEVVIHIGGENWEYIAHRLRELASELREDRGQYYGGGFGGGGGGCFSVTIARREVSIEDYRKELDTWWMSQKEGNDE